METTNQKDRQLIGISLSPEMFETLQSIAKREFNSVQGIMRKYISEGIEADVGSIKIED